MPQPFNPILTFNLFATTVVFYAAARLYLLPRLGQLSPRAVLLPILLLHAMRHLGLMFLAPGAVYPGMPLAFARPAAFGDLIAALLAFVCIPFVARGWKGDRLMVWAFNIFGTLDLLSAVTLAIIHNAPVHMGAAYWIPAFWVPALLVTHYVTFIVLTKEWARPRA